MALDCTSGERNQQSNMDLWSQTTKMRTIVELSNERTRAITKESVYNPPTRCPLLSSSVRARQTQSHRQKNEWKFHIHRWKGWRDVTVGRWQAFCSTRLKIVFSVSSRVTKSMQATKRGNDQTNTKNGMLRPWPSHLIFVTAHPSW